VTNLLSIGDLIEFPEARRIKKRLILTETMTSELLCYEPGQGTAVHHHVKEDEVFYCIESRGTISVDDEVYQVKANELVFAPVTSHHGIQAADDSRFVVIYFRSPGRKAAKTGIVVDTGDDD
jgi:mannose-6-phosphate isomerase-like protein (cupin superfamily)